MRFPVPLQRRRYNGGLDMKAIDFMEICVHDEG